MANCNKRLLRWQDTVDQTTIGTRYLEKLEQPTVRENGQRVPGLNVHNPRLYLVLAAVFQFAHLIDGFRNRDLRLYLQRRFGLSPDEYTAAQLRYDLLKLQAKGWIRKLKGKTLYVLTPKGMIQVTALVKLNQCPNGALGSPLSPAPDVSRPQSDLQKAYRRVRKELKTSSTHSESPHEKPKYLRTFSRANLLAIAGIASGCHCVNAKKRHIYSHAEYHTQTIPPPICPSCRIRYSHTPTGPPADPTSPMGLLLLPMLIPLPVD